MTLYWTFSTLGAGTHTDLMSVNKGEWARDYGQAKVCNWTNMSTC